MKSIAIIVFILTCLVLPAAAFAGAVIISFGSGLTLLVTILISLLILVGFIHSVVGIIKGRYEKVLRNSGITMAIMLIFIGFVWYGLSTISWR